MTTPTALVDTWSLGRWQTALRTGFIVVGATIVVLVAAAGALGMHSGAALGPTEIQVGVAGVLLLLAGVLRWPARLLAEIILKARDSGPVTLAPLRPRDRLKLAAIVALALAFRVWMIGAYWPSNQIPMGMALWDAEMGRNLLQGRGWVLNWNFVERMDREIVATGSMVDPQDFLPADDERPGALQTFPQYAHTPGYSLWLATSFMLGGAARFVYSQWMQAALDAAACLLVFGIARRLWSTTAGLLGALFYALSPAHVYLSIQTVAAATDAFWPLLVAYGIVRTWDAFRVESLRLWPLTGVLMVVVGSFGGTLMNSTALLLPIVSAAWAGALGLVVGRPAWRVAGYLLVAQLVVLLLLTPWGLRNKGIYGQFTFARATYWQLVWETLGEVPNPWGLAIGNNDEDYFRWVRVNCSDPCSPQAREAVTRDYLFTEVFRSRKFPAHVVRLVAKRLPGFIYVSRLPADKVHDGVGVVHTVVRTTLALLNIAALLIVPTALLGLGMLMMRQSTAAGAWLGLAPSAFIMLFSLAIYVEHRKTTPAFGYLLALSGVSAAPFVERAEDH